MKKLSQRRLLSELEGKIKHVLLSYVSFEDYSRIAHFIEQLDRDVRITIFYDETNFFESKYNEYWHDFKRLLHLKRKNLELIVDLQKDSPHSIDLVPIWDQSARWVQDRLHVLEDKVLMPSISDELSEKRKGIKDEYREKTNAILESPYWRVEGFSVIPFDLGLVNSDGGDLIPFEDTLFAGSYLTTYSQNNKQPNTRKRKLSFYENKVKSALSRLDNTRKVKFIGIKGKPIKQHIDLFFTPEENNTVLIADVKSTLKEINLPKCFVPDDDLWYISNQLDLLAKRLSRKYEVKRLPGLPPQKLHVNGKIQKIGRRLGNRQYDSDYLIPFMTFNNVVREKYIGDDGKPVKILYFPFYPVRMSSELTIGKICNDKGLDMRLAELNVKAYEVYESLGYIVRPVKFPLLASEIGSLRCSTKVLQRS